LGQAFGVEQAGSEVFSIREKKSIAILVAGGGKWWPVSIQPQQVQG
jgi:hypothetical protein